MIVKTTSAAFITVMKIRNILSQTCVKQDNGFRFDSKRYGQQVKSNAV